MTSGTSDCAFFIALTCALRTTVSSGSRMNSSLSEVVNAASDQRPGVVSGASRICRLRKSGEAAEKMLGIEWNRAVGSHRSDDATKEGRHLRFDSRPLGG